MSNKEWVIPISFKIWDNFASDFDELVNIEVQNRKSDIGFSEFNSMTIKMRPWTTQIWNTLTWTWWVSKQFFFIDFFKKTHHIKWYDKKVFRLDSGVWNNLWINFISNNFNFTPMLLPMMLDWSIPTEYTTPANSSWAERVKKSASDSWWAANIGKYLIITENTANTEAYRWAFASILDYDSWTAEYTLNWAWITTILKAWAKYQIYDTLWEHLEVANWAEFERFFFWKSDWTIVENTKYTWLATKWLRNVKWILDTEFIKKQISYDASYWTFNKNTLYYSAWALNNPFLYNFTTVLSIPGAVSGYINDLFVFKDRLIIWGSNYAANLKWPITSLTRIDMITESYGIVPWTLADVWVDWYFISTNKHIYSLKENISWTALLATDEGKIIRNYLKNYNFNLIWAFDWSKLYFYWEEVAGETWIMTVLDIQFKFWSTYTWLAPSSIIFNEGITYLSDNNSDKIRKFDNLVETDIWQAIQQKVSLKEISWWAPFNIKSLTDIFLRLDNYPQELSVSLYMANPWVNTRKNIKNIKLTIDDVTPTSEPIWEWVIWEWLIWWIAVDSNISLPIMKKITYDVDNAVLWKIIINWKWGSSFYLNQLDVWIIAQNKAYFSPNNTI